MNYRFNEAFSGDKDADGQQCKLAEKFVIRLPAGYRKKIAEISKRNRRSMNSEIVLLLEKYLSEHFPIQQPGDEFVDHVTTKLVSRFQDLPAHLQEALLELMDCLPEKYS